MKSPEDHLNWASVPVQPVSPKTNRRAGARPRSQVVNLAVAVIVDPVVAAARVSWCSARWSRWARCTPGRLPCPGCSRSPRRSRCPPRRRREPGLRSELSVRARAARVTRPVGPVVADPVAVVVQPVVAGRRSLLAGVGRGGAARVAAAVGLEVGLAVAVVVDAVVAGQRPLLGGVARPGCSRGRRCRRRGSRPCRRRRCRPRRRRRWCPSRCCRPASVQPGSPLPLAR